MITRIAFTLTLAAAATLAGCAPSGVAQAAPSRLTVIELYQSQGCSSCPPATANLNALVDRADILAFNFGVTYWDYLGWKDVFAKPQFTDRQWDYARAAKRGRVYTPQMVINGRGAIVGGRRADVQRAITANPMERGPAISAGRGKVSIAALRSAPATVWLVHYDPRTHNVAIGRGENGGRTLPHRNVVRDLKPLGEWTGQAMSYPVPATPDGLASAVLVQRGKGGPIIAATRI